MFHRPDATEGEKVEGDLSHGRPDRDYQLHPLGQPRGHLREEGRERVRLVGLVHLAGAESVDEDQVVAVLEEPPLDCYSVMSWNFTLTVAISTLGS